MNKLKRILKNGFRTRNRNTNSANKENDALIQLHDEYGRELFVPKSEWRKKILPNQIKDNWHKPSALYSTIITAMRDGFNEEVVSATERLLQIDKDHERAFVIRAIILMNVNKPKMAEQVLNNYIKSYGETGIVLTNLAKIYSNKNDKIQSLKLFKRAIDLDPNQENGLQCLIALEKEQFGAQEAEALLKKIAQKENAWCAKLLLAREYLHKKKLNDAMKLYYEVLSTARDKDGVLMEISGSLGNHGYIKELIELIYPNYNPKVHNITVGLNLLKACLDTKNKRLGQKLLHRLYEMDIPSYKKHLLDYSDKFDDLSADENIEEDIHNIKYTSLMIDKPIWLYNLSDPNWLIEQSFSRLQNVVFMPFSVERENVIREGKQKIDIVGRFSRGIPLYLSECLFMNSHVGFKYIQLLANGYPAVCSSTYEMDSFAQFMSEADRYIVTGKIKYTEMYLTITLQIWDYTKKQLAYENVWNATENNFPKVIANIEDYFLNKIIDIYKFKPEINFPIYAKPSKKYIMQYIVSLEQLLALTLCLNKKIYGERRILENLCYLEQEMENNSVGKIMLLSGLSAIKKHESDIYLEFDKKALGIIPKKINHQSLFDLLSIYIYKIYDMKSDFEVCKSSLAQIKDDAYQNWLSGL